jgi:hypothetical protein
MNSKKVRRRFPINPFFSTFIVTMSSVAPPLLNPDGAALNDWAVPTKPAVRPASERSPRDAALMKNTPNSGERCGPICRYFRILPGVTSLLVWPTRALN